MKSTGELARTFRERFKEHLKALSPIYGHQYKTGHSTPMEDFNTEGRKVQASPDTSKCPSTNGSTILPFTEYRKI